MNASSLLKTMEDWGYYLMPKAHADSPGYGGVLIAMRQTPTEQHYDPELLELRLADQSEASWTSLIFYSSLNGAHEVLPGRVIVIDRFDKHIEFFTFGATVEEIRGLHDVVFALTSDAPVLMLTGEDDNIGDQIAYEAEGLLARRQALQVRHVSPILPASAHGHSATMLYQISLEETIKRFERIPMMKMAGRGVYAELQRERQWLMNSGNWLTANPLPDQAFSWN
jgi:hypothetical protein